VSSDEEKEIIPKDSFEKETREERESRRQRDEIREERRREREKERRFVCVCGRECARPPMPMN